VKQNIKWLGLSVCLSVCAVVKYSKIQIGYKILTSGKLLYLATLWSWNCKIPQI